MEAWYEGPVLLDVGQLGFLSACFLAGTGTAALSSVAQCRRRPRPSVHAGDGLCFLVPHALIFLQTTRFRGDVHCDGGLTNFIPTPPVPVKRAVRVTCFNAEQVG